MCACICNVYVPHCAQHDESCNDDHGTVSTSTYKRVPAIFFSTDILVITIGLQKKCQTPAGHCRKLSAGPHWRTQAFYQVVIYVHVRAALICRHVATGESDVLLPIRRGTSMPEASFAPDSAKQKVSALCLLSRKSLKHTS